MTLNRIILYPFYLHNNLFIFIFAGRNVGGISAEFRGNVRIKPVNKIQK